jgi:hypothetical protein
MRKSAKRYVFEVVGMNKDGFRGRQGDKMFTVRYEDVETMEVRHIKWHI